MFRFFSKRYRQSIPTLLLGWFVSYTNVDAEVLAVMEDADEERSVVLVVVAFAAGLVAVDALP